MSRSPTPQGSNAERSRSRNRQAVLGQLHSSGVMGRAEIARALGLSTQAVSNIIADLAEENLLVEKGRRMGGRGLPAVQYALNPEGGYALGIEVRPDAVFAALLDMEGSTVFDARAELTTTAPAAVAEIVTRLKTRAFSAVPAAQSRALGAGIVMPGPFGPTGLSGQETDLKGWETTDARALFQDALTLPIEVSNDANAAAMAERISGAAHGLSTYAYLYFGTGLGLGLVSQGHLITGAFGNAGEIGHIPIPGRGGPVPLEQMLSRVSIQHHLASTFDHPVDYAEIDALFEARNPLLIDWLASAAQALSHATQIIENMFDPQTIILGGALPSALLTDLIAQCPLPKRSVSNRPDSLHPRLSCGRTGRLTATRGAAALILNRAFTPQLSSLH